MPTFTKFYCLVYDLGAGVHQLQKANHEVRVMLTNTTPDTNNHVQKGNLTEVAANGANYANQDIDNNWELSVNIARMFANNATDIVWTANAGNNFGPFRYAALYNNNSGTNDATRRVMGYWDYGSSITCNNGESFTLDFPANGTIFNMT